MDETDFLKEYGHTPVQFESYYKYTFTYRNDDLGLSVNVGGDSTDIYRCSYSAEEQIENLGPIQSAYLSNERIYEGDTW